MPHSPLHEPGAESARDSGVSRRKRSGGLERQASVPGGTAPAGRGADGSGSVATNTSSFGSPSVGRVRPSLNAQSSFAGPSRLTAGQVLEGGRTGRDTSARPGQQGFARDAFGVGNAGRATVSGGFANADDQFFRDIIGGR